MYVCMYIYIYMYICIYVYVYIYIYICICIYTSLSFSLSLYMCIYIYIYIYMYVHIINDLSFAPRKEQTNKTQKIHNKNQTRSQTARSTRFVGAVSDYIYIYIYVYIYIYIYIFMHTHMWPHRVFFFCHSFGPLVCFLGARSLRQR